MKVVQLNLFFEATSSTIKRPTYFSKMSGLQKFISCQLNKYVSNLLIWIKLVVWKKRKSFYKPTKYSERNLYYDSTTTNFKIQMNIHELICIYQQISEPIWSSSSPKQSWFQEIYKKNTLLLWKDSLIKHTSS